MHSYFPFNIKSNIFCLPPSSTCQIIAVRRCFQLESRTASCGERIGSFCILKQFEVKWKEFAVRNGEMKGKGWLCTLCVTKHVSVWGRHVWNKMCWWWDQVFSSRLVLRTQQVDSVNYFMSCNFVWTEVRSLTKQFASQSYSIPSLETRLGVTFPDWPQLMQRV